MAIKFEFVLEDVDAENLFSAIRDSALRNDERVLDIMLKQATGVYSRKQADSYIAAFRAQKEYTLGLITKMTNCKI